MLIARLRLGFQHVAQPVLGDIQFQPPVLGGIHHLQQQFAPPHGAQPQQFLHTEGRHDAVDLRLDRQRVLLFVESVHLQFDPLDLGQQLLLFELQFVDLLTGHAGVGFTQLRPHRGDLGLLFGEGVLLRQQPRLQLVVLEHQQGVPRLHRHPGGDLHLQHIAIPGSEDLLAHDWHQPALPLGAIVPLHIGQRGGDSGSRDDAQRPLGKTAAPEPRRIATQETPQRHQEDPLMLLGVPHREGSMGGQSVEPVVEIPWKGVVGNLLDHQRSQRLGAGDWLFFAPNSRLGELLHRHRVEQR